MNADRPLIALEGIGRRYEGKRGAPVIALHSVSLKLYAGEFVCITGPSGSGKTTLMNILGCLDRPDGGTYSFAGHEVHRLSPDGMAWLRLNALGFVFQNYNLLGSVTARENVEMPGVYAGLAPSERRTRALGLLAALGLMERGGHRAAALSGGEQQRVSIARAMMNRALVILADEPTGALDKVSGHEVLRLLEQLAANGHTVILITHNADIAARGTRQIHLLDGRVISDSGAVYRAESVVARKELSLVPIGTVSFFARLAEYFRSALAAIRGNLLRARRWRVALTVSSIVLGVWTVVTMLTIAEGTYRYTLSQLSTLGADQVEVAPLRRENELAVALTLEDALAIAQEVSNVRSVVPRIDQLLPVRYGSNSTEAIVEGYAAIVIRPRADDHTPQVEHGQFITRWNNENRHQVAVIGWQIQDDLIPPGVDPVGQYVMVGDLPFLVAGVLTGREDFAEVPDWLIEREGRRIVVPFQTAAALLHGSENPRSLDVFMRDPLQVEATESAIRELLVRRHASEGFSVTYRGETVEQVGEIRTVLWLGLGSIGGIALIAGGMGVMAIMLMAVAERTREIGIRIAIGARRRDILEQFVFEAVTLALVGGLLGLLAGVASGPLMQSFDIPVSFSPWMMIVALVCAAGTGLVFGIAPARRAARLDPVAALSMRN